MRRRVQAGVRRSLSCLLSALTEIPDFATSILSAADFPPCPFLDAPLTFAWPFNFRAAFAARFSACLAAFRSALAFRRALSARASARFFLRFFSQASHLQPIGFR